jgi:hypothetical protein
MKNLSKYQSHRDKFVSTSTRSLNQLFHEKNTLLLKGKEIN